MYEGRGSATLNADPHPAFHRNVDPIPVFHFNAYPDTVFRLNADPDSVFHLNGDQDPDPAPRQSDGNLRPLVYRPSRSPF
jgi:hypothetical protein